MRLYEKRKKKITINIASLIDVMFLLLIFFMVSSTFVERPGMKLDLPEAEKHEATVLKDLILQVAPDGKLVLNDKDLPEQDLPEAFRAAMSENESTTLILQADQAVAHGRVVRLMDEAKKAGVKRIVIAVRSPHS